MPRGDGIPGPSVNINGVAGWAAEDLMQIEVDNTTNANYTFISYAVDLNAAPTDPVWMCKRITQATGSVRFAKTADGKASSDFRFKASLAATYTY